MTRFVYSLVSLLMLTMGVATFDFWGNRVDIPIDGFSEDVRERSLIPVRHTRVPLCPRGCDPDVKQWDFGRQSHPRYLTHKPCLHQDCVRNQTCVEIHYTFNVTLFSEADIYENDKSDTSPVKCFRNEKSTAERISIACLPAHAIRQYK